MALALTETAWIAGLALLLLAALVAVQYSPVLLKRVGIAALERRAVDAGAIVLTYDDGPGPAVTGQLLELLAAHDARATFFLSGQRIDEHREVAEGVAAAGHELASHGFEHLHAWRVAPGAHGRDYRRGAEAVRSVDSAATGYRPPHGKLVATTWWRVVRSGGRLDWWTDDSGDSFAALPEVSPAAAALERGGGVVLLHDLDRSEPRNRFVLETTRALLVGAKERGLRVVALRDLAP